MRMVGGLALRREAIEVLLFKEFSVCFEQGLLPGIEFGEDVVVEFQKALVVSKQSGLSAVKDLRAENIKLRSDLFFLFGSEV